MLFLLLLANLLAASIFATDVSLNSSRNILPANELEIPSSTPSKKQAVIKRNKKTPKVKETLTISPTKIMSFVQGKNQPLPSSNSSTIDPKHAKRNTEITILTVKEDKLQGKDDKNPQYHGALSGPFYITSKCID